MQALVLTNVSLSSTECIEICIFLLNDSKDMLTKTSAYRIYINKMEGDDITKVWQASFSAMFLSKLDIFNALWVHKFKIETLFNTVTYFLLNMNLFFVNKNQKNIHT